MSEQKPIQIFSNLNDNIGVNVVGVTLLKLAGDEVVGVPFLARDAGVSV